MLTRHEQRSVVWIDLVAPTDQEIYALTKEFSIDPILTNELISPSPKSKVERVGDVLFLVLHFPALRGAHARPEQEVDFIIGKQFLITTRYSSVDPLHAFSKAFEVESILHNHRHEHAGHLFVEMIRSLYKALTIETDRLHDRLDEIEDRIFAGRERQMVAQISLVGRMIHDFRRTLEPHHTMLESLEPYGDRFFGPGYSYHLRSVIGEYERVRQTLDHLRDWLHELRETNNSLLSTKQNDIMKNLTVMAFITFPLTLFSSLFAINTTYTPIVGSDYDFWIILGIMSFTALTFFAFFKYKKWI